MRKKRAEKNAPRENPLPVCSVVDRGFSKGIIRKVPVRAIRINFFSGIKQGTVFERF
jgi:hypothetical protein